VGMGTRSRNKRKKIAVVVSGNDIEISDPFNRNRVEIRSSGASLHSTPFTF